MEFAVENAQTVKKREIRECARKSMALFTSSESAWPAAGAASSPICVVAQGTTLSRGRRGEMPRSVSIFGDCKWKVICEQRSLFVCWLKGAA